MLSLRGQERIVQRDEISFIIIHNTYENPLARVEVTPSVQSRMKRVYVESTKKSAFVGWPVKFIENLVVFFDQKGRQHVLELNKILRLRPYTQKNPQLRMKAAAPRLSYGDSLGSCRKTLPSRSKGIIPTRVLADKIQISEFLNNFEKGYERVNSYQERTYLYPKPVLFDQPTKFGVTLYQKPFANPLANEMPMFFQWSSGRPYRFQSYNFIGYGDVEYLPTVEPLVLTRNEVKSHFFRGSFVGNLAALPAGSEYYTSFERESGNVFNPKTTRSGVAVNYMALMGGDYENWSLSIGSAYNTYYIQVETYFREILGSAVSPVLRLMWTGERWKFFGVVGNTDVGANNPTDLQVSSDQSNSVVGVINNFNFESRYLRGGFEFDLDKKTKMGANFLYLDAKYKEALAVGDNNFFNWNSKDFNFFIHKQFGEYVALRIFGNSINFDYSSEIATVKKASTMNQLVTGGAFEFVF